LKNYELLVLIKPGMEQELLNSLYKNLEELIAKYKGIVECREELPRKPLAYNVKRNKEGVYCLLNIKMNPADIRPLDNDLKLNESIIRAIFTQSKKGKSNG